MAREIIIYEQIDGTPAEGNRPAKPPEVRCLFVYPTKFRRLNNDYPLTPVDDAAEELLVLLNTEERALIRRGRLSVEIMGLGYRPGSTDAQRDAELIRLYRAHKAQFIKGRVDPVERDVIYIDVPSGRP